MAFFQLVQLLERFLKQIPTTNAIHENGSRIDCCLASRSGVAIRVQHVMAKRKKRRRLPFHRDVNGLLERIQAIEYQTFLLNFGIRLVCIFFTEGGKPGVFALASNSDHLVSERGGPQSVDNVNTDFVDGMVLVAKNQNRGSANGFRFLEPLRFRFGLDDDDDVDEERW